MRTYSLQSRKYRAVCADQWPRERAERWLESPRERSEAEMTAPDGERVFVKHHCRPFFKAVADTIGGRKSPARKAFEAGMVLQDAEVAAVRPYAMIESLVPGESFTILEFIEGLTLRDFLLRRLGEAEGKARKKLKAKILDLVARSIAKLHTAKVRQRDLKALNVMVQETADGPRIVFVDLEGMHNLGYIPTPNLRARDLARLCVSLRTPDVQSVGVDEQDWRRLVKLYLGYAEDTSRRDDIEWWIERTLRWAERKEARNERNGRPIA